VIALHVNCVLGDACELLMQKGVSRALVMDARCEMDDDDSAFCSKF
jgi:hypothetical protein